MKPVSTALVALLATLAIGAQTAVAQDQDRDRTDQSIDSPDQDRLHDRDQLQDADAIYGESLMTDEEKLKYRDELAALESEQERERYRYRHRLRMQERAREQGVELPDMQEAADDTSQVPEPGAAPMPGMQDTTDTPQVPEPGAAPMPGGANLPGSHGGGVSGSSGGSGGGGAGGKGH